MIGNAQKRQTVIGISSRFLLRIFSERTRANVGISVGLPLQAMR
jgi:hypothetical protein